MTVVHVSENGNTLAPSESSNVDVTPISFATAAAATGATPAESKYVEINTEVSTDLETYPILQLSY